MVAPENLDAPHFVVVGHPNKGKSTIVSTLACDSSVEVDAIPGTTQDPRRYPMLLGDRTLYILVDTPGFQRPRRMLEYLKSDPGMLTDRNSRIMNFLKDKNSTRLFPEELKILSSIMHPNSGIIYVVDGNVPYSVEYEPEMEILQWSGQPRMALINPILGDQFIMEWQRVLRHYFGIVKIFNPITSPFNARIDLLKAFEQLDSSWSDSLKSAQSALLANREMQEEQAASTIAEALLSALQAQVSIRISPDLKKEHLQERLTTHMKSEVSRIESMCWKSLDRIFRHSRLSVQKHEISILQNDIFSKESIRLFGLSKTQLTLMGLATGGTTGALLDVALGGTSILLGSALGAGAGAVSANIGAGRLLKFRRVRLPIGSLPIGSHKLVARLSDNLNVMFIILARAITYYSIISERAHGNRSSIAYDQAKAPNFDTTAINRLGKLLQKNRTGVINEKAYTEITRTVLALIRREHMVEGKRTLKNAVRNKNAL